MKAGALPRNVKLFKPCCHPELRRRVFRNVKLFLEHCHPEPRRRVVMFQAALLLWSFLASHSFTVGNAIQHDAIFKMACNHLLFTIIFKQAAPTEPVGYFDCGLNMPVACPYKQGAALQPGGWTTRRLAELRLSFVLFVYPLWSRSCGMVRSFGPLRHQKLRHLQKRIRRTMLSN